VLAIRLLVITEFELLIVVELRLLVITEFELLIVVELTVGVLTLLLAPIFKALKFPDASLYTKVFGIG
jgi:hypothetical protein